MFICNENVFDMMLSTRNVSVWILYIMCTQIKMTLNSVIALLTLAACIIPTACGNPPKLLLISMDGFKHDYLSLPALKPEHINNFQYFIDNGVKADQVINVFPTVTYPNHFSLITGLYPESHGVVHNRFYDPDPRVKDTFWYDNRRDNFDPVWFDVGAEPIYVTNQKAGKDRRSGSALWPCGLGKVKGIAPNNIIYDADPFSHINFTKLVDTVIEWYTDEIDPINLGLLYFDEPDETGHRHGAGSDQVVQMIIKLNDVLGHLFERLKEEKLGDEINIILTADHGFANVTEMVSLSDYGIYEGRDYNSSSQFLNHITEQLYTNNVTGKPNREMHIYFCFF